MINISQVKKYEQVTTGCIRLKSKLISLFAVVLLLICTTCLAYGKNELLKPSLEISEKYYKKEAILKFNEAVQKWELKDAKSAILLWNEAVLLDPNLWIAYLGLGQAYDSEKEYQKSLSAYNKFLKLAPKASPDRESVLETVKYLTHLLRYGEEAIKSEDYLALVKTKHQGKEHYVRWDLSTPVKIYFYPASNVQNYKREFEAAFLEGAKIWQEALPDLKFEVVDNKISGKKAKEKEKEIIDSAQIKVIFPSRFKVKGDPNNPIASEIEAQSFPIIRDKKNFRVLGVIMISPFIYFQSQIAIPLEPLSKLKPDEQIKKLKIIAARETGHALGLWGFSPNPDDLMFDGDVGVIHELPLLSDRDITTIKKLYELNPEKDEIVTNNK